MTGDREWCPRVQLGTKRKKEGLVVRERHPVRFSRMAPNVFDELLLVLGASLEPAVALEHPFHDSSR